MSDAAEIVRAAQSSSKPPASRGMGRPLAGQGTWVSRAVWSAIFLIGAAVLITAGWLHPDPAGHGTHTQLGLPPCGFLVMTGLPCPGCGLTTSFAHMVRLQVGGALQANPFGVPLFLTTLAGTGVALGGLVRGWPVIAVLDRLHFEKVMVVLGLAALGMWVARIGPVLFH